MHKRGSESHKANAKDGCQVTIPDAINGTFEAGMAVAISFSINRLISEKRVFCWSIWSVAWPTAWGIWNLYYYPSLNQIASTIGGIAVVIANATWISLAVIYSRRAGAR